MRRVGRKQDDDKFLASGQDAPGSSRAYAKLSLLWSVHCHVSSTTCRTQLERRLHCSRWYLDRWASACAVTNKGTAFRCGTEWYVQLCLQIYGRQPQLKHPNIRMTVPICKAHLP